MRTYQMEGNHTNTNLTVRIAASGVLAGTSWGVKDLLVVMRMCDVGCVTCFGGNASQCYKCQPGYYLLGNTCVDKCPFYVV